MARSGERGARLPPRDASDDDRLAAYRAKRDAARTPEPFAGAPSGARLRFVVQRHSARALHYDLRLEQEGVLASWAVPKGLPTHAGARHLAVRTEDHPLAYADFEGVIPAGEYGAGTMDIYDRGTYEVLERKRDGGLSVRLEGERLRGRWELVPAQLDGNERNWLVIRASDDDARPRSDVRAEPMLATLADDVPVGDGWLYEVKWDGYRLLARLDDGDHELWSRRGVDLGGRFAEIAADLGRGLRSPACVVDGEACALDPRGQPSFSLLQRGGGQLVYYVFDLLELDGETVADRPLVERRALLEPLVDETSATVRLSRSFADGRGLLAAARAQGLEGVVAKRADSPYQPGRRSRAWQKVKVRTSETFAIVGYTLGEGSRGRLGSLVLARDRDGGLAYVGNVGSGLRELDIERLLGLLEPLRRETSPLPAVPSDPRLRRGRVVWVEPRLHGEVAYAELTGDGRVRAPVWLGLREVAPASTRRRFERTNLDKLFFADDGVTKGDLLAYYEQVAPALLPHLRGRPFTMRRQPDGIAGKHFFQKDAPASMPEWIARVPLATGTRREGGREMISAPLVDDVESLLWMVAMGCIDLHTWQSRLPHVEHPDWVLFDLDPGPEVAFDEVVRAAQLLRVALDGVGLRAYPKTSGADGLHVCVPIEATAGFDDTRRFAGVVAQALERAAPDLVTTAFSKRRRSGVYLDWKQNALGATLASVYSVRPVPGASVSCPLRWDELAEGLDPRRFSMAEVLARVEREGDLFAPVLAGGQRIEPLLATLA